MARRNGSEQNRVSGLMGMLSPEESLVANALLDGRNPANALAEMRGKTRPGASEAAAVGRAMASERVRRTLAGAVGTVGAGDLRRWVVERLVTEAEDAREGSTRVKALELVGNIPGVDVWKQQDDRAESLAEAGFALAGVLDAVASRLSAEVVDVDAVQAGPEAEDSSDPAPAAGEIDWGM